MKYIPILLCALILSGCAQEQTTAAVVDTASQTTTVEDVLQQGTASVESDVTIAPSVTQIDVPEGYGSYGTADIDLCYMSSTMVYTQVYNMMVSPADYADYVVKMNGTFAYYYDDLWDEYYYAVIIMDATACCAQGIEFVLTDDAQRTFPDDYPEPGDTVTVVGVYTRFFVEEYPDWEYYRLEQAEFITDPSQ